MKLYFLRHGHAAWPEWKGSDDDRPLNARGIKETHQVAAFLRRLGVAPDVIVSSPLPRADQTARITAGELGSKVVNEAALSPGFGANRIQSILAHCREAQEVMIVGHEPDFSKALEILTGARLKLAKSGVALVETEEGSSGKLIWLFPPALTAG